jgi:hypothetical protein
MTFVAGLLGDAELEPVFAFFTAQEKSFRFHKKRGKGEKRRKKG